MPRQPSEKKAATKKKAGKEGKDKKKPTPYNEFMKKEMAAIKAADPNLAHKDAFKLAASRWKTAPENTKRAGAAAPPPLLEDQATKTTRRFVTFVTLPKRKTQKKSKKQ